MFWWLSPKLAFLVQLTTVMVPILSAITGGKLSSVPLQTWLASIIAFIGVIVMGSNDVGVGEDGAHNSGAVNSIGGVSESFGGEFSAGTDHRPVSSPFDLEDINMLSNSLQMSKGDFLIILAAFAYTMHVVRLGNYAPRTTPLKLAASKATTEAFLSVLLVLGLLSVRSINSVRPNFVTQMGDEIMEYFKAISTSLIEGITVSNGEGKSLEISIAAILWTGWVTCAYTIYGENFSCCTCYTSLTFTIQTIIISY